MKTRNGNYVRVTGDDGTCERTVKTLDLPECVDNVFHFSVDVNVPSMNDRTVVEMKKHAGIFEDLHAHFGTGLPLATIEGEAKGETPVGAADAETLSVRAVSDAEVVAEMQNDQTRAERYMLMGMYATQVNVAPGGTLNVRAGFRTFEGHFVYDSVSASLSSETREPVVLSRMHARMLPDFVRIHGYPSASKLEECAYVPSVKKCDPEEMCSREGVPCVYLDVDKTEGDGKHYANYITYALHDILSKFEFQNMDKEMKELTFADHPVNTSETGIFRFFPNAYGMAQIPKRAFDSIVDLLKGMPEGAGSEPHYADDPDNIVMVIDKRAAGAASMRVHFLFARKATAA